MYSKQSLHYKRHRPIIPSNSEDMTFFFLFRVRGETKDPRDENQT